MQAPEDAHTEADLGYFETVGTKPVAKVHGIIAAAQGPASPGGMPILPLPVIIA